MQIELKNIGMIKEANVKLDGLTVIAGENDTGKSTVGKALFLTYSSMPVSVSHEFKNSIPTSPFAINGIRNLFHQEFLNRNAVIAIKHNNKEFIFQHDATAKGTLSQRDLHISNIAFIETPTVWNLQELFKSSVNIESQFKMVTNENIDIPYPFLLKDLSFKLMQGLRYQEENSSDIRSELIDIIQGEFKQGQDGVYRFYRGKEVLNLINVATGIKMFGILQVLLNNNRLNSYSLIILDEPEVHLHPKWQLKIAEVIVNLVKNGVRILVNSHSPYMIEALKRYSEVEKIENKTNFYLAKDGFIAEQESLENIFETLALPMRELKKLKMDRYLND